MYLGVKIIILYLNSNMDSIDKINKKFNEICKKLQQIGANINEIKKLTIDIYNEIKELKNEKYCNIVHKDDLNFQVTSYYNNFIYHRKFLNIKKNKIFNDLYIFNNLLIYLINFSNLSFKSQKKVYLLPKKLDLEVDPSNQINYKIEEMKKVLLNVNENYQIFNQNLKTMKDLCQDLKSGKVLLITNIFTTFQTNIESLEIRINSNIINLLNTLNYHSNQLDFYNSNLIWEKNTLIKGIQFNNENLEINISFNKKGPFKQNQELEIKLLLNRELQDKFAPSYYIFGSVNQTVNKLEKIDFLNYRGFIDIRDEKGIFYIGLCNIIDIFGNNNYKIIIKDKLEIIEDKKNILENDQNCKNSQKISNQEIIKDILNSLIDESIDV